MPLARDLNDLIHKYGGAIAAGAESVLIPRHRPDSPLPDLSSIENCRSQQCGKPFTFYPSQKEKIAGALAGLRAKGRVWMVCEMGCGKSPMSLAAAWALLHCRPFRLLVMCPGHIVRKWRREVEWMIPGVVCRIIRNFTDLFKFEEAARSTTAPMVAVIGKDTAKLGFDVDRPCAAKRKMKLRVRLNSKDEIQPGDIPAICHSLTDGTAEIEVTRVVDVACCPCCGKVVQDGEEESSEPVIYDEYIACDESVACKHCGDRLLTNARGFRKNPHIDRYIQRKMKGVFDLFIADEVHELAGSETEQGQAFGTLASACRFTLALTGTLIGGQALDLHAPLWRMSAELLNQRGFNIKNLGGARISAIARNQRGFVSRYGVLEHQIVRSCRGDADDFSGRVQRGACGRRKSYKTNERPRPGISPDLFNHFLLDRAIFMSLDELGPALPTLERVLVSCPMSRELADAYKKLDDELRDAIKSRVNGKGPPGLAATRVQALDAYLDKPTGWSPITAATYNENGQRCGTETVAWPADLGENHEDSKDRKLVEIVRAELGEGRRCAVYPQFTGVHDVRPKLLKLLTDAGIRVLVMPDTVKPEAREDWIEKHMAEMDVLIVHPKRVMTGLDLVGFPSLIWYQTGYSTHVLRQASARARRPIQTKPCKVFFLYYAGTIQETCLGLMGEKEAASQALEGTFDTNALRAMMNGGESDDIVAALANSLEAGKKIDARAAWKNVETKPVISTPKLVRRKVIERQSFEHQGFLFDLSPDTEAAYAAAGE
ncbi:MAG: DEAD/DEAH box helicase [Planctomycetota bacterium]